MILISEDLNSLGSLVSKQATKFPLFKTLSSIINQIYSFIGLLFKLSLGKTKSFTEAHYIKVTTPGFAALVLISILFLMLIIAVI